MTSATDLYRDTADRYDLVRVAADAEALVAATAAAYPSMAARAATVEDAETCRLTMLAARRSPDTEKQALVWRARSLSRATVTGWTECVAFLAMGEAFSLLAFANDKFVRGRTLDALRPAPGALPALAELAVYLEAPDSGVRLGPSSPRQSIVRRFLHEKAGFLQLVEGSLDAARSSYSRAALEVQNDPRGEVKVALGAALVEYVADPSVGAAPTRTLLLRAEDSGWLDLVEAAQHNVGVMAAGGLDILGYEIL